eukprot:3512151-Lingulodinium_polyedra.AAC.1
MRMVPQIVDICRACRMWIHPGPRAVAMAIFSTRFTERAHCDLLFYEQYIVFACWTKPPVGVR